MSYNFKIFDNHIILIDKKNRYLIDTGSPNTISNLPEINLFNSNYKAIKNFQGLTTNQLSQQLGTKIDALIGGDILKNYMFNINIKDKNFSILTEIPKNNPDSMDIDFLMNIPTIKITLNNKSINAFLDTGAKISYINKKYTQDLKSIDSIEDFYPTIGSFRTDIYKMSITFNSSEISLTFGVLPEML